MTFSRRAFRHRSEYMKFSPSTNNGARVSTTISPNRGREWKRYHSQPIINQPKISMRAAAPSSTKKLNSAPKVKDPGRGWTFCLVFCEELVESWMIDLWSDFANNGRPARLERCYTVFFLSPKGVFRKSFVRAWVIEMPGGYEYFRYILCGATKL